MEKKKNYDAWYYFVLSLCIGYFIFRCFASWIEGSSLAYMEGSILGIFGTLYVLIAAVLCWLIYYTQNKKEVKEENL